MWILHLEDGTEMEVRLGVKDGKLVEELRALEDADRQEAEVSEPVDESKTVEEPRERKKPNLTPLQAVAELLRRGHKDQLPRLKDLLAAQPEVYRVVGDLGRQAERAYVEMLGGKDDLLKESVVLYADEFKKSLAGPNATPLERLAAERIAACSMEVEYYRAWLVQHPQADGSKVGALYEKRFEAAHRRMERTMTTLATIKKLLPRTIEVQLRNQPTPVASAEPVNGSQPAMSNGQVVRQAANGAAKPVVNGTNGYHNRFGNLVETAAGN